MKFSFNISNAILVLAFCLSSAATLAASPLKSGDLIFHKSQGPQAAAILEATGSSWSHVGIVFEDQGEWVVAEASMPVRIVPLKHFINRGKNKDYRIYRARNLSATQILALRSAVEKELGKPYDLYFEWSDEAIYCSELVYKVFHAAAGIDLGTIQKFSDLKLNGPYVQKLIQQRLKNTGRHLNLDEAIVTPINQMRDSNLDLIYRTGP